MRRFIAILIMLNFAPLAHAEATRLLRFPDVNGDKVAFVYAGDIYVADVTGGNARRLTSDEGRELFPKFSPDGSQIAFSAEYSGTRQVYVMPTEGGTPTQLTWYNDVGVMPPRGGFDYRVLDWTPDGQNILVRANRLPWGVRMGRHYLVPAAGGNEIALDIPEGGAGMYSPDGNTLVYTPIDREFRTWKRYRGGRAQDVWTYDLANHTTEQLTFNPATDNQPMWVGDEIFFTSDRDYTLNLYRQVDGGDPVKVTHFDEFDVLWPSAGPNAIVFENGGYLYRFDPVSQEATRLEIEVTGDMPGRLPHFVNAAEFIQSADLSPDGKRAVFAARGDIFTVPAENGQIRNISRSPTSREIDAIWSPDGKLIAFLSDRTGEYEIYTVAQDGSSAPRQITNNGQVWRFPPVWAPDSRKLAFADKDQRLHFVDLRSGTITEIDHSTKNDITDYVWAPDSRHVAYVKSNASNTGSNLWLYTLSGAVRSQLTSDDTDDVNPVFDPKGRYLYFASGRDFNLTFSDRDTQWMYTDSYRVFAGQLTPDSPALHRPKSDEVSIGTGENGDDNTPPFRIVAKNFESRVAAVNESAGNYRGLSANDMGVFFFAGDGADTELRFFDLESEEEKTVLAGIDQYVLASGGEKLLFNQGDAWGIAKAEPDQDADDGHLDLANMKLRIDPAIEWQQMYVDQWRILRDWFYEPGMHGNDWMAIRDRYQPLVAHVAARADLDYIFGEIAGELNAGHNYVQSGDQASVERQDGGLLGAEIVPAPDGYYQVDKVFPGEAWNDNYRSPLAEQGVDVHAGDYILAVDGVSTNDVKNFYELLENKGDEVVTLTVNTGPRLDGAREVAVRTVTGETNLRYLDWVEGRREIVDQVSGGRIGYLHLPNTATAGNRELFRLFPSQTDKDALIIDVRYNGGGFIPDHMIEVVARTPLNYWKQRGLDPNVTPVISHDGPKAALINGYSASGGDAFPYYFRKLGLGPLIGTRTWGGLIGISGNPQLVDNGGILTSTFRFIDSDGNWAVENEGVSPDVEIVDRPEQIVRGEDPTLEFAIQYLLKELDANPPREIIPPAAPTDFRN